jgi:hypothetical protein
MCISCREKPRSKTKIAQIQELKGGELIFSDDFERSEPGENWINRSKWKIEKGELTVSEDHNSGLWLAKPVPQSVRIEFEARSESDEGDIKFEVFCSSQNHQTGYILIMGGWNNSVSIIARLNEHGDDRIEIEKKVKKGEKYRFTVFRTDTTLYWFVNNELFMSYPEEEPLKGAYFGFNDWKSKVYFDNLKIYRL